MELAKKTLKYGLGFAIVVVLLVNGISNYIEKEQLKNEVYMEIYGKELNEETGRYE